jgi:uncharacterized protein (TIGR02246 family)
MAVVLSVSAVLAGDSDDVAIRSVIQSYMDARNHMDQAALRKLFTSDADQLVSTGQWRHGLDELLKGALASSKKENSRSSVTVESVRILGNDTAIVDGRYETTTKNDSSPRKMWSTFILQRTADGWRIAAIRNMLPAAP